MGNQGDNKFIWVIKDYCTWRSDIFWSDEFVIGGCKWYLQAYFKRDRDIDVNCLYLDLGNADFESAMRFGHRCSKSVQFTLTVVNQLSQKHSQVKAANHWFDMTIPYWDISMIPLTKLHAKDGGFLVNNELVIVAVIDVLDVPEGSVNANKPLKSLADLVDVNGFQVPPSQVESVSYIFERHPDIASEFRPKNQHLRSAYMNVLLSLIEMMCQSTQELSKDDLVEAYAALAYLTDAGLNLNWLEEKLDEVFEKKENEEAGETRMQEIEQELKELKLKCSNLEAQLEKEKAGVSVARAPLLFDDSFS